MTGRLIIPYFTGLWDRLPQGNFAAKLITKFTGILQGGFMKKMFITAIATITVIMASGQQKTDAMLFGDVKSKETNTHIPYSTIFVKGTNLGTIADSSGHFILPHLPEGKTTVIAQAVGYKAKEAEVFMMKNEAVTLFFELEEDILQLDQFVVTGTRTQRSVKDVPVRTEIIGIREIENKNACNIYQALEGTPGVRVENQCQSCNFTMVRMQGLGAEHTQILINGQPIYSGLAGVFGLQQMSTIDIGQIEVVKGAGSALYGSGAVAGAINIVTKEPAMEPSATIDVQFGNHNTNRYGITSSMRNKKGNIGVNIFAQRLTEDAIDQTGEGLIRSEVKGKDNYTDRVDAKLTTLGFALYFDNAFFKNDKLILRGKAISEFRSGGFMEDDTYKNPYTEGTEQIFTDRYETQLSYTKKIRTRSEINLSVAYVSHKRNATNDTFLTDYMSLHNDSTPDVRDMRPYLADENSVNATFTFETIHRRHRLLFGAQGNYLNLEESGMYMIVDPESEYLGMSYKSVSKKSGGEFGLFFQDEWVAMTNLTVIAGLRFDSHNSGEQFAADEVVFQSETFPKTSFSETSLNPRVALKYDFTDKLAMRASVGTGYRAPFGFSEELHLCSGSPRVWKSSDLEAETSVSYNVSADYYSKNTRTSINFFRTRLNNKIGFTEADPDVSALGYDYQWRNIDDAVVQGVELSFLANVTRNLDLGVDLTFNYGAYENPREDWVGTEYESVSRYISRFPVSTGNLKVEYRPGTLILALFGNYQGNLYIDYYNLDVDPEIGDLSKIKKTDPFMLFNAKVSKQVNQFRLYAGVNNIFNYLQDERHLDDAAFMYAPIYGTMVYGGVSFTIGR